MNEVWNRILSSPRWFAGFVILMMVVVLFIWHLISPESYFREIDSFTQSIKTIIENIFNAVLTLAISFFGLYLVFRAIVGRRGGGNNNGGRH